MHRNVKYKNGTNFNSGLTLMGLFRNWALENTLLDPGLSLE